MRKYMENLKYLKTDIREYNLRYGIGLMFYFFCAISGIVAPLFMQKIIDDGIVKSNFSSIFLNSLIIIFIEIFCGVFNYISSNIFEKIKNEYCIKINNKVLMKIFSFKKSRINEDTIGKYINILNDASESVITVVVTEIPQVICDVIIAGTAFFLLLLINWKLLLVSFSFQIILLVVNRKLGKIMEKCVKEFQKKGDEVFQIIEDLMSNIYYIIKNGNSLFFRNKYRCYYKDKCDEEYSMNKLTNANLVFSNLLSALSEMSVWIIGGWYAIEGKLTIGTLYIISSYMGKLLSPLLRLLQVNFQLKEFYLNLHRVYKICMAEADNNDNEKEEIEKIETIEYKNIQFFYEDQKIFNNISLILHKNEKNILVGESGIGKTTLVNMLLENIDLSHGEILINGKNINSYNINSVRKCIAYVPQEPPIFNDTLYNNLTLGKKVDLDVIQYYFKALGIEQLISDIDNLYERQILFNGENLSSGQCQKIAIVRALLKNADILIFDEPTANLDNISTQLFYECINREKGRTIIIITHDLDSVIQYDNIFFIKNSNEIIHGNHLALVDTSREYCNLYERRVRA